MLNSKKDLIIRTAHTKNNNANKRPSAHSLTPPQRRKYSPSLYMLLISSVLGMPAKGMLADESPDPNWAKLYHDVKILERLDTRSLGRAEQVSRGWRQAVTQARHRCLDLEKQQLFSLVLEVTRAEPNEVQKIHDLLEHYLKSKQEQKAQGTDLFIKLTALKPRLLQPEYLIRANDSLLKDLLTANDLSDTHPALKPIVTLIKDLQEFLSLNILESSLEKALISLKNHYETYLNQLLAPNCNKALHLQPKALLSGEGFLGNVRGFTSYRISQDMARSLLSKDEYGLLSKTNTQGSHAVCFKKSQHNPIHGVHFKGNTTNTGLPVGRESAVYALSQILFPQDTSQGRMTASSLLSLNEVEIKTPLEGTEVNKAFREALRDGKTSEEFFALFPHYEREFTQKTPNHVLQAGNHVEGVSLEDFIEGVEKGKYAHDQINLPSFSEHIFISMLINPTDATPGNFMLRRGKNGSLPRETFSIVGIDNDMALEVGDTFVENVIPSFVSGQKMVPQKKHCVRVKNILYCLPLMNQPLSSQTVKRILNLNPDLMSLQWLERLKEQNARYDQLQQGSYLPLSFDQSRKGYLPSDQASTLYLPFLLDPDFIPQFCQTIRQAQIYLADHQAASHWQLLFNICPLSGRFYHEMVRQAKGSVIEAYLKIDPPKEEAGKPRKNVTYLEDVLTLDEKLSNGQTVREALKAATARPDGTAKFTQSLDQSAHEIWKNLDLNKQTRISPFLELAATTFASCFQNKANFHGSWLQDSLLLRALKEGASHPAIAFLLSALKLDATLRDPQTQQNVLHCAIQRKYVPPVLKLLLNSLPLEEQMNLLNSLDHKGLSPLDYGMEENEIPVFHALTAHGATTCSPTIALKFYKRKVKHNARLHEAFRRLMALNPEVEWVVTLEELLPPLVSRKGYQGLKLTSSTYGERQLPEDINNQIIDKEGNFIKVSNTGNHPVAYAQKKGPLKAHGLYFKLYPALPGLEEAVGRLTRQLLGFGAPYVDLVKLGERQDAVPCLISQEIPGDTLLKVLNKSPQLLKDLDEEDVSGMMIAAMLTNPEDGKPDNYIVTPHPTKLDKYRIIGIDNDQAFVPAIVKDTPEKTKFTGKIIPIAQVKTILYCLDQMKDPIHSSIRTAIINTHPDRCLEEWLRGLKRVNNQHCGLFETKEQTNAFQKYQSFIGVPFQQNAIRHIYEKVVQLRDLVADNPDITHMDLLGKLEPRLAKRYQRALFKDISVSDRFKEVDRPFYEVKIDPQKGESHTTVTQSANILQSMGIPLKQDIFDAIRLGKENGPVQALQELEIIKTEKNAETLKSLAARVGDINLLKTLNLEESRVLFLKELERQKKTLSPQKQTAILDYLAQQKGIRELPLPNFSAMDDKIFQSIDVEHLRKVDLRNCSKVTNKSLIHLSKKALALEELNLGSLTQFKTIRGIASDAPLIFKELRFLNLSDCINLSKILLQAPKLHYLSIENCALLSDQMLDGVVEHSENLRKLVLERCPLITEKELREKWPNFPARYLENVTERNAILEILESTGLELKLKKIDTSPQGVKAFEKAFKINSNLFNLTRLDLKATYIGAEGVKGLAEGNLTNLTKLNLRENKIGAKEAKALAGGNLSSLTKLNLMKNKIGTVGAKALANGNLTRLASLNLMKNKIEAVGAKALASGNLTNLTELNLHQNNIEAVGAKALAGGNLTSLTSLHLGENKIETEGAKALAKGNLANLTQLGLYKNNIGAEGAKELAGGNLLSLTSLDLDWNEIGTAGAKALSSGNLTSLTELNLYKNNIGYAGAKALAGGNLRALTALKLYNNNIGAEGAKALAGGNLVSLTTLSLGGNSIGPEGAKELAGGNLTSLTELNLWDNNIGAEGAKGLAGGNLKRLTTLDLRFNDIGAEGAKALAGGNLVSLTTLSLGGNSIGPEGAKELAGGNLTSLTELNLWDNNIGAEGAKALAGGNFLSLTSLDLGWSNIGAEGAKGLAGGNLKRLTTLDLRFNDIGDEGAKALAGGNLTNLTSLNLTDNNVGDEGAKILARGNLTNITVLNLWGSNIKAEGAKALAEGNLASLTELDLRSNKIGDSGKDALKQRYPNAEIKF